MKMLIKKIPKRLKLLFFIENLLLFILITVFWCFLGEFKFNPFSANFTKWSNTLKQFVGNLRTNYLSVFDHFVGLALKGLSFREELTNLAFFCSKREICWKLTIKTTERHHWHRSGVFIVNFEYILHIVLVFLLLTLNM